MKTANNPFLATIQNKTSTSTSTTSNIDNRHSNSNSNSSNNNNNSNNTSNNANDKGNKKLRRQTISDPHAYMRYIHSLLGDKCISKPCESTLEKFTTTTTAATTTATRTNNDKSQKQCQQQQLQQIGLQFQGIALYDDDVAKSQNNSSCSNNNNESTNNRSNNNQRKSLEQQQQQQYENKLVEQIRNYNIQQRKSNNNNNNKEFWMDTYPTTRFKRISNPISNMSTITYTTTTNVTRMTPKIAPTILMEEEEVKVKVKVKDFDEGAMIRPIKSALRKHHSFNMQPTYIMHKQMYLQQKLEKPQSTTKIKERDVNEIEQQLMTSRYQATFGGPLVFRPLTLNEKHNFKPIAKPDGMSVLSDVTKLQEISKEEKFENDEDESKYSSILSEQVDDFNKQQKQTEEAEIEELLYFKEIEELNTSISSSTSSSSSSSSSSSQCSSTTLTPTPTNSPSKLHPAASLEVLEALTHSNPELIYAAIQPGSRLNLHTQLSALNEQMSAGQTQLRAKLHATLSERGDNIEDNAQKYQKTALRSNNIYFGNNDIDVPTATTSDETKSTFSTLDDDDFCFYEIETENENENDIKKLTTTNDKTENDKIVLNTSTANNAGQVKYLVKQNLHEIHI